MVSKRVNKGTGRGNLKVIRYSLRNIPTYDPNDPFKNIVIGECVDLHEVAALAVKFDITYGTALKFLNDLGVPNLLIGDRQYFSIHALSEALFVLSEHGSLGYQPLVYGAYRARRSFFPRGHAYRPAALPVEKLTPELFSFLSGRNLRKRMDSVLASRRIIVKAVAEAYAKLASEKGTDYISRLCAARSSARVIED